MNYLILFLLFPVVAFSQNYHYAINAENTYTLTEQAATSAGVYDADGNLLRTLWTNVTKSAGTYNAPVWDGLDDQGQNVSATATQFKIVANNITAQWEGVVGNTSESFTGPEVHAYYNTFFDMMVHGNKAYFSHDYGEREGSVTAISLNAPNKKEDPMAKPLVHPATMRLCTDGVHLYMGCRGGNKQTQRYSFVCASPFSELDDRRNWLPFQGETVDIFGNNWKVGDKIDSDPDQPRVTGLAVQKTATNLFIAREKLNSLRVIHKTTGVLRQNLTYTAPKHCKIDGAGNFWMIHGQPERIEKFTINATTGQITSTGFTIGTFDKVEGMAVSPDGTTVAVSNSGTFDQVFGYSTTTGALLWTLGRAESYRTSATVYDDKFYLRDIEYRDDQYGFLEYEADGSLWVNDGGNHRYLKFDTNRNLADAIMWRAGFYSTFVDPNDPTRIFGDFLEYEVDYSKPLTPGDGGGSWKLVNNWGGNWTAFDDDKYGILKHATTLNNGKTYCLMRSTQNSSLSVIAELVDNGILRNTGVTVPRQGATSLKANGKFRWVSGAGGVQTMYELPITGFNANDDPILGTASIWASYSASGVSVKQNGARKISGEITDNGTLVIFDGHLLGEGDYHLGGIKQGANQLSFLTAKGVVYGATDPYPSGTNIFDARPAVKYPGSVALAMDDWIIWGYNGEFWNQTQTNKWHMVSEEGLFLRDFGTVGNNRVLGQAQAEMAGNAFSPAVVKIGNDVYLYHNDEIYHAGVHRWKISNLSSIKKFTIPIN